LRLTSAVVCSLLLGSAMGPALVLGQSLSGDAPKVGAAAPELTSTQLLQAPAGAKADWRSLRGKVVVLEFWATWCAPCIGEIPILNRLADSIDPAKVQFIAVDDEEPAVVAKFLKKKPISGWVLLDTSGAMYKRFGVEARPATIVIGPDGKVVSTTVHPEQLQRTGLLALAAGKPAKLETKVDAKTQAELNAGTAKAFEEQAGRGGDSDAKALFEISVTKGDASQDTHAMMLGDGKFDIMNGTPRTLLSFGLDIPGDRIMEPIGDGGVPAKVAYSLHVQAPGVDPKQLADAVIIAVASAAGLHIERLTKVEDVYLIQPVKDAKSGFSVGDGSHGGFGFYSKKTEQVQLINATVDQLASGLEDALSTPVLNESGVSGTTTAAFKMAPKNVEAAKAELQKLGLTLVAAQRPVDRLMMSVSPKDAVPEATAAAK
jgi:thiol-disulfide isomerase/thioredoxin